MITYLSTTESTRNSGRSTLNAREEGIEDTLSGQERVIGLELVSGRSGGTDGPELEHRVGSLLAFKLGLEHDVLKIVHRKISQHG